MDKDGVFLTTDVLPLAIKYTVVVEWRSPADGVAGLGGLTVQALCLSGYSHYPPPQPPAELSLHQGGILWLTLENGNVTVQALCLSGYSHYPPPQPPAQLSLHQGGILWLTLENGNGAGDCKDVFD